MNRSAQVVEVESLDLEGRGVGRCDGKVVFVEGALPGERVLVEPLKVRPGYETARLKEIMRGSALRTVPRCPHFGIGAGHCGGCAMQHLEPGAQVAIKQRALEDALWHLGRVRADNVLRPIEGPSWHYRQRARFAVRWVPKKGGVLVGFHERRSSYVADMRECHVVPRHVSALLPALRDLVGRLSIAARLPQIELAVAGSGAATHTVLVFRVLTAPSGDDLAHLRAFARAHRVSVWLQPGGPETAAPLDADNAGALVLQLPEFGVGLPFQPTDFTQVNHGVNETLVRRALRLLAPRPDERVVDFFCGLGNFTLPLATRAAHVTGIEGNPALVERARAAAVANGLAGRVRLVARDLFDWNVDDWRRLEETSGEGDAVVGGGIGAVLLDPPREGALALVRTLARVERPPRRLVYVSCNPGTLARDCAVLVHEGGWRLRMAGVVNMFPHTAHVESIAVLEPERPRRAAAPIDPWAACA